MAFHHMDIFSGTHCRWASPHSCTVDWHQDFSSVSGIEQQHKPPRLRIRIECRPTSRSRWRWAPRLWGSLCWHCWRCSRARGREWWGAPFFQELSQATDLLKESQLVEPLISVLIMCYMKEGPMKMKAALKIKIKTVASLYLEESEMKSRKQVQKVLSVVIFYCPS